MIGLLKSAEQYVEVKSFLKQLNAFRGQVAQSPETFAAFLNGKTPDVNSVKDICRIMSQVSAKNDTNKQQALYTKYLSNLAACNAITNNKGAGNKLPTYEDVDNSYYCFRQEITDASKKGPSSFVFADSSYASTVDAEKKKLVEQQKAVDEKKKDKKKAKRSLRKHRLLKLLLGLPILAIMAATGFAFYAGLSWLAVQTLTLSPLALVAALLPAYGGYKLSKWLLKKPWNSLTSKIKTDKADYKAKKQVYEQEKGKLAEQESSFNTLAKDCEKNLAVKYPFEENFSESGAQMLFAERLQQIKEPNQTDEKQEIPTYEFSTETPQMAPQKAEAENTKVGEEIDFSKDDKISEDDTIETAEFLDKTLFKDIADKDLRTNSEDQTEEIEEAIETENASFANTGSRSEEIDPELLKELDNEPEVVEEIGGEEETENSTQEPAETHEEYSAEEEPEEMSQESVMEEEPANQDETDAQEEPAIEELPQEPEQPNTPIPQQYIPQPYYQPWPMPYPMQPIMGQQPSVSESGLKYPATGYVNYVKTEDGNGYFEPAQNASNSDAIVATLEILNDSTASTALFRDSDGFEVNLEKGMPESMVLDDYFKEKKKYKPIVKKIEPEIDKGATQEEQIAYSAPISERKQKQAKSRQEKREAFKAEGRNVSKDEAIEIMNATMEDDYAGSFDELNATEFAKIESAVNAGYESAKAISPGATINEEDYLEGLYRASYEKAVCDYYGRFVPREYAGSKDGKTARILSPISAKVAHEKDLRKLDYGELEDKKAELTYKQKAYEALLELGKFYEQNEEELDIVGYKIKTAQNELEGVKNALTERRAQTKEMVTAQIESLINEGKSAKITAEDLKRAEVSVKETIKTYTDKLSREKKLEPKSPKKKASEEEKQTYKEAMAQHTKRCEDMQAEIDRNEQIRTLLDAYNFYKSNSYKTKDQISENLEAASLSQSARVYLNAMFRGAARKNTPKAKTGEKYLEEGTKTLKKEEEVHLSKYIPVAPVEESGEQSSDVAPQKEKKAKAPTDQELDAMLAKAEKHTAEDEKQEEPQEPETLESEIERIIAEETPEIKVKRSRNKGDARSIEAEGVKKKKNSTKNAENVDNKKADKAVEDAEALLKELEAQEQNSQEMAQGVTQEPTKKNAEKKAVAGQENKPQQKAKVEKKQPKEKQKQPQQKGKGKAPLKKATKAKGDAGEKLFKAPETTAVVPYIEPTTAIVVSKPKTTALDVYREQGRKEPVGNPRNIPLLDNEAEEGEIEK